MRAHLAAEVAGFLTVSIIATGFVAQANAIALALGVRNFRFVEYPGTLMTESLETIREKVAAHIIDPLIERLTSRNPT